MSLPESSAPFSLRRHWPYLAVIGVLIAVIVYLLVKPGHDDAAATRSAHPNASVGMIATHSSVPAPVSTTSSPSPSAVVPDITFDSYDGAALPVSRSHGPFHRDHGLARGFTHDQLGAALAAANLVARCSARVGPSVYEPTIKQQALSVPADVFDALHEQYELARDGAGSVGDGEMVLAPGAPRIIGYRIQVYSATSPTVVHLLTTGTTTQGAVLVDSAITVQWIDGQWKIQVPPGADFPGGAAQTTAGFSMF